MTKRSLPRIAAIIAAVALVTASGRCGQREERDHAAAGPIREPVVAGAFYPDDADLLTRQVDRFLENVPPQSLDGRLVGLVVPHAGYIFSGQVAAYSYRLIRERAFGTVVLVGCSHRARYPGASVYSRGAYRTPLGTVPIDETLAGELISRVESLRFLPEAHQAEHSLEVQLPFLQRILNRFRIVPILLGPETTLTELEALSAAIAGTAAGREDVLLVASTDLTHYPNYEDASRVDRETLDLIAAYRPEDLAGHERRRRREGVPGLQCAMCGTEAVMVVMMAARMLGADQATVLHYANSGDVPAGDHDRVVGYGAVALWERDISLPGPAPDERGDGGEPEQGGSPGPGGELGAAEQLELLEIARASIAAGLKGEAYRPPEDVPERLLEKRGAFVTLHKHGRLRGCIGQFQPDAGLVQTVARMAQAAAFHDSRFPALTGEELAEVEIEISVLSPLRQIYSIDQIELGTHGIWVTRGGHSGCYLPQVADQTGWSRQEFVEHCCQDKASLPPNAYLQEDTHLYVFTAQVFEEP
jgi:AmmeMemoRadiSam system protein B/AmmeMemoRadiSam system protein A